VNEATEKVKTQSLQSSPYFFIYDIVVPKDNILRQIKELVVNKDAVYVFPTGHMAVRKARTGTKKTNQN
jgi:hypothetical protein